MGCCTSKQEELKSTKTVNYDDQNSPSSLIIVNKSSSSSSSSSPRGQTETEVLKITTSDDTKKKKKKKLTNEQETNNITASTSDHRSDCDYDLRAIEEDLKRSIGLDLKLNKFLFQKDCEYREKMSAKDDDENDFATMMASGVPWPKQTEVDENYLNEFEKYLKSEKFKFLAFNEQTEKDEQKWYRDKKTGMKLQQDPWEDHEWSCKTEFELYLFVLQYLRVGDHEIESSSNITTKRVSIDHSLLDKQQTEEERELCAKLKNVHFPDTRKMEDEDRLMYLFKALGIQYINHPLFYFAVNLFEGVVSDTGIEDRDEKDYCERCEKFLYRMLDGCQGAVFTKFKDKSVSYGMTHVMDSQHLGAAAYMKAYINTRFLKRFPIQTNFINPKLDNRDERIRLSRDFAHKMRAFTFVEASKAHPAALMLSFPDNDAFKDLLSVETPDCWHALNHFYEWTVAQPNRTKPKDKRLQTPPILIADIKNLSLFSCNKKNIARLANTFRVAMFHPEPFGKFVIANAPMSVMALFSFGKLFMSESARLKFVMTGSSLSKALKQAWKLETKDIPQCCGGEEFPSKALSVEEILTSDKHWLHQKEAIERTRKRYPEFFAKFAETYGGENDAQLTKKRESLLSRKSSSLANRQPPSSSKVDSRSESNAEQIALHSTTTSKLSPSITTTEEEEISRTKFSVSLFLCIFLASFMSLLFKTYMYIVFHHDRRN